MTEITVTTLPSAKEIAELLRRIPESQFKGAKKEFHKAAFATKNKIKNRIRDGANNSLHSRTGNLRNSILFRTTGNDLRQLKSTVFSDLIYAPIQETGGTITAKKAYQTLPGGPYLNIPLKPNKTASGVTRLSAKQVFNQGGYIVQSAAGKWLVMLNDMPQFVLKKSVTLPPRLGMRKAAEEELPNLMDRLSRIPLDG